MEPILAWFRDCPSPITMAGVFIALNSFLVSLIYLFHRNKKTQLPTVLNNDSKTSALNDKENGSSTSTLPTAELFREKFLMKEHFLPDDFVNDNAYGDAPLVSQMCMRHGNGGVICNSFHDFVGLQYQHDADLKHDIMLCTSRAKIGMEDNTVDDLLASLAKCLRLAVQREAHFCSMYDMRHYHLKGIRDSYARARVLLKWMEEYEHMIDKSIHAIALIVPSSFSAKLLKKIINFVILIAQPVMAVRVFEDDEMQARSWLKKQINNYNEGNSTLKPRKENFTPGLSEYRTGFIKKGEEEGKNNTDKEDRLVGDDDSSKKRRGVMGRIAKAAKSLSPLKLRRRQVPAAPQNK